MPVFAALLTMGLVGLLDAVAGGGEGVVVLVVVVPVDVLPPPELLVVVVVLVVFPVVPDGLVPAQLAKLWQPAQSPPPWP